MPRANRYFLPGYVWHITINTAVSSNRSKRSIAALRSSRSTKSFGQSSSHATGAVIFTGFSKRRSALDFVCSITL